MSLLLTALLLSAPTIHVMGRARVEAEAYADGQDVLVRGWLRDDLNQPIEGARLALTWPGQRRSLHVGSRGAFSTTITLPPGEHTLRLRYEGGALLLAGEATVKIKTGKGTPRLKLTGPQRLRVGVLSQAQLSGTRSGDRPMSGAALEITLDDKPQGLIRLDEAGRARLTLPPMRAGLRTLVARFEGDARLHPAEARLSVEVIEQIKLTAEAPTPLPGAPLVITGRVEGPPSAQLVLHRGGALLIKRAVEGGRFTLEAEAPPGRARFTVTAFSHARGWESAHLTFDLVIPPPPPPAPWPRWPLGVLLILGGVAAARRLRARPKPAPQPKPAAPLPPPFDFRPPSRGQWRARAVRLRVTDALSGAPLPALVISPIEGPLTGPLAPPRGPRHALDEGGALRFDAPPGEIWVGMEGYVGQRLDLDEGGRASIRLYPLRADLQRRYAELMQRAALRFGRETPREARAPLAARLGEVEALTAEIEAALFGASELDAAGFTALSTRLDAGLEALG